MKSKKLFLFSLSSSPPFSYLSFTYLASSESEIGTTGRAAGIMSPLPYRYMYMYIRPGDDTTRRAQNETKRNETDREKIPSSVS